MAKTPYMPLCVQDFTCKTMHLTSAEVGQYILILCAMWANGGHLGNDARRLARIARCSPRRISPNVMKFFTVTPDGTMITNGDDD